MQSIHEKIKETVLKTKRGVLLFPEDFNNLGSSEGVRLALHRLEKQGIVTRIAQGIYVRPEISKHTGAVLPSAEQVAMGIAKRDRIKIVPTGVYALNALGLNTQIPTKLVYLTDGAPRVIKIGNRTIKFKKNNSQELISKGRN